MSTIYVIDDSISVCIAIEKMLSGHGFEVATARSGSEAMDYLRRERPDLVICDLVLPDLDGSEICAYVRGQPRFAATPVIAISGLIDAHVKAGAERAGAMRILKKPFTSEELLRAVEDGLAGPSDRGAGEPAAAPAPLAPLLEDHEIQRIVDAMSALPSLRFGLLLRMGGEVVRRFGDHQPELSEVVEALIELVRRSASVAEWLGQTDPHRLVFQADDGMIFAQRYGDYLIVLTLTDPNVFGMARLVLDRMRCQADRGAGESHHTLSGEPR